MAEGIRFTSENDAETSEDDDDLKSKKKKSSRSLGSSATAVVEKTAEARSGTAERPKMNAWDKLLASLTLEKANKTNEKAKAEGVLAELASATSLPELRYSEKAERAAVEKLEPVRELTPDEINGGEVVINLRGEKVLADEGELEVPMSREDSLAVVEASDEPVDPLESQDLPDTEQAEDPVQPQDSPSPTSPGRGGGNSPAPRGGSGGGRNSPPPPPRTPAGPPPPPPPPPPSRRPPQPQPVPPPQPGYNYNAVPLPSSSPNVLNAPQVPYTLAQLLAQQQAVERALYRARRRGRGEGLLGGIVIGGAIEHIRHKSRERKMEKKAKEAFKKQEKRIEGIELEHQLLKTEQLEAARKAEAERYQRKADAKQQLSETARLQMAQVDTSKRLAEQQERNKAELIDRLNAQAAEQERLEAEQLLQNSENHIETSAWHSIEVDKRGHAVQETDIAYGHEYYKERAHETAPKDVTTRDSVTGATALSAATMPRTATRTQQIDSGSSAMPQPASYAQQSDMGLPPMLGMPLPPISATSDSAYKPSAPSATGADDSSVSNPVSVLILLIILGIVVTLIIFLL